MSDSVFRQRLPQAGRRPRGLSGTLMRVLKKLRRHLAETILIAIPTVFGAVYYTFIATPRYVSETQFIVRGINSNRTTGLDALFRTIGVSRMADDANIVQNYLTSRDALGELSGLLDVRGIFSAKEGDFLTRFPRFWETDSNEGLYSFYRERLRVVHDSMRGITTMRVDAYDPRDAQKINMALLHLAEGMVNRINARAQSDTVASAEREVDLAREAVRAAQLKLGAFRKESVLVDPTKNSTAALDTVTALTRELAFTESQIQGTSQTSPSAPGLPSLRAKAMSLRDSIAVERAKIAGNDKSLAGKVSTYESLTLDRDMADKNLLVAAQSLDQARAEARRKQIYVERVAEPSLADEATEPQRLRMNFTVFLTSLMVYCCYWVLSVGAKEHAQ